MELELARERSSSTVDGAGEILALVRSSAAMTTSGIAAAMGLARSTVTQRLDYLAGSQLLVDEAAQTGSRGRPAAAFRFNPAAGIVLSAQIGMTGSRFAVADLAGTIIDHSFRTTDVPSGPERLLDDIVSAFEALLEPLGTGSAPIVGVGVGIPSSVELASYAQAPGQDRVVWDRDFFRSRLWERFDVPVFLDLDVNLLALAERQRSWTSTEVFVCVKLGTLINASIVVNGRPVHGVKGLAGEMGHMKVAQSIAPCSCGSVGCLDAVASGRALVALMRDAGFEVDHVADVVQLADRGEPAAIGAIRDAGRQIGEVLASVVNLLNPGVIAAWGYLVDAREPLFAGIRQGIYENALPGSSDPVQLVTTTLGSLAGVRGAAMMVTDQVLAPHAVDRRLVRGTWSAAWSDARPAL